MKYIKKNQLANLISVLALIVSVLSLFLSYRLYRLQHIDYQPFFMCSTSCNNECKDDVVKSYFSTYYIDNVGEPIKNVTIDVYGLLCIDSTTVYRNIELLTSYKILDSPKYDISNQNFVVSGRDIEYLQFIFTSFFYLKENQATKNGLSCFPLYIVHCKRILKICYTNREGKDCSDYYELKENYIKKIQTPSFDEYSYCYLTEVMGVNGYTAESYEDDMENVQEILSAIGIDIEKEKEENIEHLIQ